MCGKMPTTYFLNAGCLQKKSYWQMVSSSRTSEYDFTDTDHLNSVLKILDCMSCSDSPHFQFLYSQLQLLLCSSNGRRFDRNTIVFVAELHHISPGAYRMLRNSGSVIPPRTKLIKNLLSNTLGR